MPTASSTASDNWRPLLASLRGGRRLADRARRRRRRRHRCGGDEAPAGLSSGHRALYDVRRTASPPPTDEIPSKDLVEHLVGLDGRPWAELGKSRKPMTTVRLARMLKPLGIVPGKIGPEKKRVSGYVRSTSKTPSSATFPGGGS